ncbi:MAG: hypothetical protein K1X72_22930 [Pyrinomonadaceae bacterium]|nr:hypothetical protein [Pyrinomonadaceae bacterium]
MKPLDREEQNSVLKDCSERLENLGIDYISMALVHYAIPRTTTDIDVIIELSVKDADRFIRAFEGDYYVPHNRVRDAISRNKIFNVLNQQTIIKIDCIIRKNDEFNLKAFSRKKKVNYSGDFEVWIISKEDLIISKLNWAKTSKSEMQMRDVASIIRNGYDEEYVDFWVEKLGLKEIFQECVRLLEKNYVDGYDS